MRYVSLALCLLLNYPLLAFPLFGQGTQRFEGVGKWKTQCGGSGTYRVHLTFQDGEMSVRNESDGTGGTSAGTTLLLYKIAAVGEKNGLFEVTAGREASAVIGNGYCFRNVCHYQTTDRYETSNETFRLDGDTLYVAGSRWSFYPASQPGCANDAKAWSAKLTRVD